MHALLRIMNQLNVLPRSERSNGLVNLESFASDFDSSLSTLARMKVFFRSDFSKEVIPLQNLESSED